MLKVPITLVPENPLLQGGKMIDTKGEKFPQKKSSLKMEPFQIDGRRHSMHCDMRVSMRKSSDKLLDLALFETGDWGRWVTTESGRIM